MACVVAADLRPAGSQTLINSLQCPVKYVIKAKVILHYANTPFMNLVLIMCEKNTINSLLSATI